MEILQFNKILRIRPFVNPGTYTVKLVINGGVSTATKTITVNASPVVNFNASDITGTSCFPLLENFTNLSTPAGTIASWNWDFGDGTTSNKPNPSHVYTAVGNFPVSLQVTGTDGCSGDTTKLAYINISSGVTAGFTANAASGCKIPVTINFSNTSTGPGTLTYAWTFGDGNTSTAINPTDSYNAAGSYVTKLTVSSSSGCTDTISENIVVGSNSVQSSFTAPDSVCLGTAVSFQNTSVPNPATSSWDFGDGTTSTSVNATKTYTTAGLYTVKLVNNFGGCTDSTTNQITILPVPVASFTVDDSVTCTTSLTANFTNTSTNATIWLWTFGDGTTSILQNPSHTYSNYGSYTVTLTASNSVGCSNIFTKTNYIEVVQPTVSITDLPLYGCAPLAFTPTIKDSLAGGIVSYLWDFGDGTTSTAANPSHIYSPGVYVVKLTLTGAGGCSASTLDTVKAGTIKPTAAFTAAPTTQCVDQGVTFTDQSTGIGANNNWLWDFGDMNSSTIQNPTHSIPSPAPIQ